MTAPNALRPLVLLASLASASWVCLGLPGCATPGGPPLYEVAPALNRTLEFSETVLAPGDKLEIRFPEANRQDLVQEVTVLPDGFAHFLFVDRVKVAGLTPVELDEQLTLAYQDFLNGAFTLTVVVAELGPRTITILGQVGAPGQFVIDTNKRLTLLEALGLAGGPLEDSGYLASTLLVRWDSARQRQHSWVFDARTSTWGKPEPLFLQPYDLVYVPPKPIVNVGVWVDQHIRDLIPFPTIVPN